jgi:hypothetical protein
MSTQAYFSAQQLAAKVGKSLRTIRLHTRMEWLKKEPKTPGVRGARYSQRNAEKWAAIHYPDKSLC